MLDHARLPLLSTLAEGACMDMERSKDADYEDSVIDACWTMETDKLTSSLALPRTVLVLNQKDEKQLICLFSKMHLILADVWRLFNVCASSTGTISMNNPSSMTPSGGHHHCHAGCCRIDLGCVTWTHGTTRVLCIKT